MKKKWFVSLFIFLISKVVALDAQKPNISSNSTGQYVYDVWMQNNGSNDILEFSRSTNYGATFSSKVDLSSAGNDVSDFVFVNSSTGSNIYFLWQRFNGTNDVIQFKRSTDYGQNFSSTVDLSNSSQNSRQADICSKSDSANVYAVWSRFDTQNYVIQFKRSTDYGASFFADINLSSTGQNASNPKVQTNDSANFVAAVWSRSNGVNDIIEFTSSADAGVTWNTVKDISNTTNNCKYPQIIVLEDYIYCVWIETVNTPDFGVLDFVKFTKSTDSGASFSIPVNLSINTLSAQDFTLTASQDGQYLNGSIAQFNSVPYNTILATPSIDYGTTWYAFILPSYRQSPVSPDIAASDNGQYAYVVWTRSDGTNDLIELSYTSNFGKSWISLPLVLSLTGNDAKNPRVSTSSNGQYVNVTWARNDGSNDVIQSVYSNNYGASFSTPITISN